MNSDEGVYPSSHESVPVELTSVRVAALTRWLRGQGFADVEVRYRLEKSAFEVEMRPVTAPFESDQQVEQVLRRAGLQELNHHLMTRLLIAALRRSGFEVGFSEVSVDDMNDSAVNGFTYTAPLQQLFDFGAPQVGP